MSLFIEQPNLCLPTTKTTEMIEISIIFIILLIFRYFWKKYRPMYRLFEADTNTQKKADTDTSLIKSTCISKFYAGQTVTMKGKPKGKWRKKGKT